MPRKKTPTFEEFWAAYPVHKARIDAERAWKHVLAADKVKAVAGIPAYRDECLRTGANLCYGQGYLNGRRWEDEPGGDTKGSDPSVSSVRTQGGLTPLCPPPDPDEMETW